MYNFFSLKTLLFLNLCIGRANTPTSGTHNKQAKLNLISYMAAATHEQIQNLNKFVNILGFFIQKGNVSTRLGPYLGEKKKNCIFCLNVFHLRFEVSVFILFSQLACTKPFILEKRDDKFTKKYSSMVKWKYM